MRLHTVPAVRGAQWVGAGWRVFARKPLAFTGLFAFFLFAALAALLLPLVGPFVMLALLPLATLGFMIATREALTDRFPTPGVFIVPLRGGAPGRRVLLQLGVLYALASVLIMVSTDAIDGGRFEQLQQVLGSGKPEDARRVDELLDDPALQTGLFLRLALASLLAVPFWHAPALAYWAGQGAAQSLFSSVVAVWRNRGAFVVYVLVWAASIAGFGMVTGVLLALFGVREPVALIALPAGLTFSTVFYASLYFTFNDCFSADGEDVIPPPPAAQLS